MDAYINRLLYLRPGELMRAWPFFVLYLVLFAGLAIADGLSLALFVHRVGADALPTYLGLTAILNLALMAGYMPLATRQGSARTFHLILCLCGVTFAGTWAAIRFADGGPIWFGVLFIGREIAYTLVLMHFGTFLQDYFSKTELNRVLPVIYGGGRLGGVVGGGLLARFSGWMDIIDICLAFAGLCMLGSVAVWLINRTYRKPEQDTTAFPAETESSPPPEDELRAASSWKNFFAYLFNSPLLLWLTISTLLFSLSRSALNLQYNTFFGDHFEDGAAMAAFLGRYTQYAMLAALFFQVLLVSRLIAKLSIGGAYLLYGGLVFLAASWEATSMTLAAAVFARAVETEIRLGLRNPLKQLISNQFARPLKLRVRAWSSGVAIPLGTLLSAGVMGLVIGTGHIGWLAIVGIVVTLAYLLTSAAVWVALRHRETSGSDPIIVRSRLAFVMRLLKPNRRHADSPHTLAS